MSRGRSNSLIVQTPEGIEFSILLAGPVVRLLAWGIDICCISLTTGMVGGLLKLFAIISQDLGLALVTLAGYVISVGYGIGCEWLWRGQTLGKRLLRLRVVDEKGLRLQFSQVVVRNLLRVVDGLPLLYMVGGAACLISGKSQRLGDIAASTIVVRNPELSLPEMERLGDDKFNSLAEHPHLAARLRQKVGREELAISLSALMRREELEPAARVELFGELAGYFRALVRFPHETVAGVSDERYVRNVVEVVLSRKKAAGSANSTN
jgi:uncharacterized RDD family membrane protein YckC